MAARGFVNGLATFRLLATTVRPFHIDEKFRKNPNSHDSRRAPADRQLVKAETRTIPHTFITVFTVDACRKDF